MRNHRIGPSRQFRAVLVSVILFFVSTATLFHPRLLTAQGQAPKWNAQEQPIVKRLNDLRQLPDNARGLETKHLALEIRKLPPSFNKVELATGLATLSTEGDPGGRATVQEVATTLADSLAQSPVTETGNEPAMPYFELATLARYEHVQVSLDSPEFTAAVAELKKQDDRRAHANFMLTDLNGKSWTLRDLEGKVVLVNFWATWCPPCRREMPDLESLYKRFKARGFVILGISDEKAGTVQAFIHDHNVTYPILLDPERKVNQLYSVEGIPMSFVYNRAGKLVSEAADMRTHNQFLAMLAAAGLY